MTRITPLIALAGLVLAGAVQAQSFQEGVHYHRIEGPESPRNEGRVEVVEVFGYLCPGCRNFHPHISQWEEDLPEYVDFRRVPVVFQRAWEPFARAYHTAQVLGILDQSHSALFHAVHDERRAIRTMQDLAEFHAGFGVEADTFLSTSRSFAVDSRMRQGSADATRWQVTSTPTVVVNGKWRVTVRRGGGYGEMIDVIDYLIAREAPADNTHTEEEPEVAENPAT